MSARAPARGSPREWSAGAERCPSVCPHDCPSTCALEVEVLDARTIGRVYGRKGHAYTDGVICAKVARYAERIHHPARLTRPLRRVTGAGRVPKREALARAASGDTDDGAVPAGFEPTGWDEALDEIATRFAALRDAPDGAETIWPYHYAGTMGLVQRDGLDRFRHAFGTSRQHATFCTTLSDAGWAAGAGAKRGSDARLMHHAELVVVWGGNPVATQVNVMHHLARARRESGAAFVVVDPYRSKTAEKADLHLMLRPGTDGALACAVMHVLFAEDLVDRDYIARHTSGAAELEAHVATRTPAWAAEITGLAVEDIVRFARLYGGTRRSFLRLGYGFSRSRNGAVNLHAASCLPALSGAWREPGGGALYGNGAIYDRLDRTLIRGLDIPCATRTLDQSRIGAILCGDDDALVGGPPVRALFVQNTNPAVVAPESARVLEGLAREDLFTVVHEQFMTETARLADLVLPATMSFEHDDLYTASGHTHLQAAVRLVEPPAECRENHDVLRALAGRLGLAHAGFETDARGLCEATLACSGLPALDALAAGDGVDLAPPFETANFLDGFGTPDGRFRFAPDWPSLGPGGEGMPALPDHWESIDAATLEHPLRLVAAPARQFLNTSFTETPSARRMEGGEPRALLHPDDIARHALVDGALVTLRNALGEVTLRARAFDGLQPGTVVVESLWPNADFPGGLGINTLISAEPGRPNGGAVFHDTAVGVRMADGAAGAATAESSPSP
mgnify:CR=1 FL=1